MFESKNFSKNQRRGLYTLLFLCVVSWTASYFFKNQPPEVPVEIIYKTKEIIESTPKASQRGFKSKEFKRFVKKEKLQPTPKKNKSLEKSKIPFSKVTEQDLMVVNGIGPVLSQRVIKFRNALGGFYSPDQIYEVYGLDSLVAEKVRSHFDFQAKVKEVLVNHLPIDSLAKHPYISYREAKAIVQFVQEVRPFDSVSEIEYLNEISSDKFRKIVPYLSVKKPNNSEILDNNELR